MLNLIQHPWRTAAVIHARTAAPWTLKQVQGDGGLPAAGLPALAMLDFLCANRAMTAALRPNSATTHTSGFFHRAFLPQTYRASPHLPASLRRRITLSAAVAALTLTPATAQQVASPAPSPYTRAIAAGYKALTLCNGIFSAGRTMKQIEADELQGIYSEYDALIPTLPATLDRERWRVHVDANVKLGARVAIWNEDTGCTLMPIGWSEPTGPHGEQVIYMGEPSTVRASPEPWPVGDRVGRIKTLPTVRSAVDGAFAGKYGDDAKTVGIVILHDGQIAAERYAEGFGTQTTNRTWSVAKSIAGTLVGIAHEQTRERQLPSTARDPDRRLERRRAESEVVDPNAPATVVAWDSAGDLRGKITLDNLLRMASGLHSDTAGNRTDAVYFGGAAVDQETVGWLPESWPGARFRYANNDILLAMLSLRSRLGSDRYARFPATALFKPLGMYHTQAGTDWRGNFILSSQVWSTARDLARLGQFWLQDGVWQGKRLLPEGWMRYMNTPSGPQPATGPGYGATMWLFGPTQGLPAGSYAAQGNRGQLVMIIPSKQLIIVRRGEDPGTARFDIARFAADVIAAVP